MPKKKRVRFPIKELEIEDQVDDLRQQVHEDLVQLRAVTEDRGAGTAENAVVLRRFSREIRKIIKLADRL